jgi:hypothetical protein
MRRVVVRYQTRPEAADENARLIQAVFGELQSRAPEGLRYLVLRLADGSFVHVVEQADGAPSLTSLDAFKAFAAGIRDRALVPPATVDAEIVGSYRMLGA